MGHVTAALADHISKKVKKGCIIGPFTHFDGIARHGCFGRPHLQKGEKRVYHSPVHTVSWHCTSRLLWQTTSPKRRKKGVSFARSHSFMALHVTAALADHISKKAK